VKLAAVQFRPPKGRPDLARESLAARIREAGEGGVDLIVCPEMATTGYIWQSPEALEPHAEPARGPTLKMLSGLAREVHSWIVCGFAERSGDSYYNAALVVDPWGDLICCYRKVLLYSADMPWAQPGTERMTCETRFGRLAPAICMDLNDDGLIRFLKRSQSEVFAFCTNWVDEDSDVHSYWRWRLAGWQGWTVAANTWGEDEGTRFSGGSAIIAPSGAVVASAPKVGDRVIKVDTETLTPQDLAAPPPSEFWAW
jgi:predicted amidohydrolase